jgi:hypothetical protein
MTYKIQIPNSLHAPELKRCLLSPQHWVQEAKDNHPRPKGTWMEQDDEYYLRELGIKQNTGSWCHTIPCPMSQSCTWLPHCASNAHLPPPSRHSKHPSSNKRSYSNSQGVGAPLMSPTLYLKGLLQKRT